MHQLKYAPFASIKIGDRFTTLNAKGECDALAMRIGNIATKTQPGIQCGDNPFGNVRVNAVLLTPTMLEGRALPIGQVVTLHENECVVLQEDAPEAPAKLNMPEANSGMLEAAMRVYYARNAGGTLSSVEVAAMYSAMREYAMTSFGILRADDKYEEGFHD